SMTYSEIIVRGRRNKDMTLARTVLILTCSFFVIQSGSQIKELKGIVPLQSNRADIERRFGPATSACKCVYDLEDAIIQISYSDGSCKSGGSGGWNVPPGTVLRLNVHPKMTIHPADLALD